MAEKRQTEEAPRLTHAQLQRLSEANLLGILLADFSGTVIEANDAYLSMLGYTREEALAGTIPWAELIPPESLDASRIQELRRTGVFPPLETAHIHKAGHRVPIMMGGVLLEQEGACCVCFALDMTQRSRAEEEVRLLQRLTLAITDAENLNSALEITLRMVCEATGWVIGQAWMPSADGAVLHCAPSYYAGDMRLEQFRIASTRQTFPPGVGLPGRAWSSGHRQRIEDVREDPNFPRAPQAKEAGLKAGMAFPVLAKDEVVAVIEFFAFETRGAGSHLLDLISTVAAHLGSVIRRKRAEEMLIQLGERLKALHELDQAILGAGSSQAIAEAAILRMKRLVSYDTAAVLVFDSEDGEILVLAAEVDGAPRKGMRLARAALGDLESLKRCAIRVIQDLGELPEPLGVIQALGPNCARACVLAPLAAEGELIGALALAMNQPGAPPPQQIEVLKEIASGLAITIQQSRLREEVQSHAAELEQRVTDRTAELQETNAQLEAFSYSISHDLRAPLRAMQGLSQALLEDYGDRLDATGQDYARRVVAAAERLDVMIQDLLDYSRISRGELRLEVVDLAQVVAQVLKQLESEIGSRRAHASVPSELPRVTAHRATLVRVISNLIGNAIKFVRPGRDPRVSIRTEERDGWVRLWVEDNGIGIAPEHHERIWRVFERLHGQDTYAGSGIGLATVSKGTERMGGRAGVESSQGEGSRFWIELPRVAERA